MQKVIFSKYSNERSAEFAVRTDICEDEGKKFIKKIPCDVRAKVHVQNIYRWYQELQKIYGECGLRINCCELTENGVILEYLEGCTLEEILDEYLIKKQYSKIEELLTRYITLIKRAAKQKYVPSDKFKEVFGDEEVGDTAACLPVTDIDMTLNNVVINENWNLIDYEWSFDFPIPIDFVIYRMLFYYFEYTDSRKKMLKERAIYKHYGLTKEQCEKYAAMERNFQRYITRNHEPLRSIYSRITPGVIDFEEVIKNNQGFQEIQSDYLQIFWGNNGNFCEQNSKKFPLEKKRSRTYSINFPDKMDQIRIDPGEKSCIVWFEELIINEVEKPLDLLESTGLYLGGGKFIFKNADPQITFRDQQNIYKLELTMRVIFLETNVLELLENYFFDNCNLLKEKQKNEELIKKQNKMIAKVSFDLEQKNNQIKEMENTKIWKMYRKYRKFRERKS